MNHTLTYLPKSEAEVLVILPFPEFEPHVKQAAVSISESVDIEGFRKGKAPYDIVKQRIGEQAIYERAAEIAIRKVYPKVMEKLIAEEKEKGKKFFPIGRPEVIITKIAPGNEFEFKTKIALLPDVGLPDYRAIAKKTISDKKEVFVSDEEVEKTVGWLRESRAPLITVDRVAKTGDAVEIDFGVRHGGVKIENGDSRNHPVVIGKGRFIPGFEDELAGMKAGDEKSFSLVAPKEWHEKNLAGKNLDFKVTMKSVQERQVPDLTDEFVKSLGKFENVEALHANIREGMKKEKEDKEAQRIRATIIADIAKKAEIEVPEVLVQTELEKMFDELKANIESMGMKWDDYLSHIKKNPEELAKEWRGDAETRVRSALCLRAIADTEQIEVAEAEIETRANQYLQQFASREEAQNKIDPGALRDYTIGILRNEKVFELLENM